MKLYAILELDVPDEVGEQLLASDDGLTRILRDTVYVGQWSYRVECPIVWEKGEIARVETLP